MRSSAGSSFLRVRRAAQDGFGHLRQRFAAAPVTVKVVTVAALLIIASLIGLHPTKLLGVIAGVLLVAGLVYGPFAVAYPGNSMGAVMEITTRQPEKREAAFTQTAAWQVFDQYDTHRVFRTMQSADSLGDRRGKWSFWLSGNFQDSHSQPLSYVTSGTFPVGTSGGFAATNKLGGLCLATPAISEGTLFFRTTEKLVAIGAK